MQKIRPCGLLDSIQVGSSHELLFMLPFRLDRVDTLDAEMAQKEIKKSSFPFAL